MSNPTRLSALRTAISLCGLVLCSLGHAATFTVTRADDPPADGCQPTDCSLREAFAAAAATPPADTIVLSAGQYAIAGTGLSAVGDITLVGAGRDLTRVTRIGGGGLFRTVDFSSLTLEALEARLDDDAAIILAAGSSTIVYRDVRVPYGDGKPLQFDADPDAEVHVRVEDAALDNGLNCQVPAGGSCTVVDSELIALAVGEAGATLERVVIDGAPFDAAGPGVLMLGSGPLEIRDSIIRNTLAPLALLQTVPTATVPVQIERTRFLDNGGPLRGNRRSAIRLIDVEIRGHVVAQDGSANADRPAAIEAQPGTVWQLNRVLVADNRGGDGADGATVRLLGGSQMIVLNSTFDNNDFHPDIAGGVGANIGVFASSATVLAMVHATMRAAPEADDAGTVLSLRGSQATVTLVNTLLAGRCTALQNATVQVGSAGNLQSGDNGCDLDETTNRIEAVPTLGLGELADRGGFTYTFAEPATRSMLRDAATPPGCQLAQLDQRGYVRPEDGIGCDIGAVEAEALPPSDDVFVDGFE